MKTSFCVLAMCVCVLAYGQGGDWLGAAAALCGAGEVEQMEESEAERFEALSNHPVCINLASRSKLLSSGLFSSYQVASLLDYRARSGDVLSASELSLVDGFDNAHLLRHFLDFRPSVRQGIGSGGDTLAVGGETLLQASARQVGDDTQSSMGAKLTVNAGERLELFASSRSTYSTSNPSWSAGVELDGRKVLGKVVLGDFNARFGQGLALWSGFSMSGFSSAASFARHPSGLSLSHSFTSSMRGVGADFLMGCSTLTALATMDGILGANLTRLSRRGQLGATVASRLPNQSLAVSLDARFCAGRVDYFGEVACAPLMGSAAVVGGATFNPSYGRRLSMLVRWYPNDWDSPMASGPRSSTKTSDELGLAFGADWGKTMLTLDAAYHPSKGSRQYKALAGSVLQLGRGLTLSPRMTLRHRPMDAYPLRADLRLDADLSISPFDSLGTLDFRWRFEAVHNRDNSFLSYLEAGTKTPMALHVRGTIFIVDNWDDRIYCYERDVPGSFTVPAYYGRGWALSIVAGRKWRLRRHFSNLALNARAAIVRYPSKNSARQDRAEFKIQLKYSR